MWLYEHAVNSQTRHESIVIIYYHGGKHSEAVVCVCVWANLQ